MLKVWGRKNSSNVQKVMWTIGELKLPHERVDIGGPFGGNKEPAYLAMNPNGLVPTVQDGDLTLWESNTIVRYLTAKHGAGSLAAVDEAARARASQWMDWQLSVLAPAQTPAFLGLIRTPPEKRNNAAIAESQAKTIDAMKILDAQLGKTTFVAGDALSVGDIALGMFVYRYWQLVPQRPELPHLKRWYDAIDAREAFRTHVSGVPLT